MYADAITDPRERVAAVSAHLRMSRTCARLILRLYDAGGKPVSRENLMEQIAALSAPDVYEVRKAVRDGLIGAQREPFAYWLTAKGLSRVLCGLNPP